MQHSHMAEKGQIDLRGMCLPAGSAGTSVSWAPHHLTLPFLGYVCLTTTTYDHDKVKCMLNKNIFFLGGTKWITVGN